MAILGMGQQYGGLASRLRGRFLQQPPSIADQMGSGSVMLGQNNPLRGFPQGSLAGLDRRLMEQGGEFGYYSPGGSQGYRNAIGRQALAGADAGRRRASILSQIMGLDPQQAAGAMVNADIQGHQGVSDAMIGAEAETQGRAADLFERLLMGHMGVVNEDQLMQNRGALDRMAIREQGRQMRRGNLGGYLGSAVGMGLGGWMAPGGFWGGAK